MPKFVIEREIPGAGKLSPEELKGTSGGTTPGLPILGGHLLTDILVDLALPMPFSAVNPNDPYTHAHELRLPIALPVAPGTFFVQVLQLDGGAPQGISFTQGMRITLGV